MKKALIHTLAGISALLTCFSCAKSVADSTKAASQEAYNALVQLRYGQQIIDTTPLQTYILEDTPGTGEEIEDGKYLVVDYWVKTLQDGRYTDFTYEDIARQKDLYTKAAVYLPRMMKYESGSTLRGFIDGVKGGSITGNMKVGGKRCFIMPGWLTGVSDLGSLDNYVANVTGDAMIYSIEIRKQVSDPIQYQVDSIVHYIKRHGITADSTFTKEVYFGSLKQPGKDTPLPADTTVYINYVGRLLNGKVFDTNIADTAKRWNIYSPSQTYAPQSVKTKADSTAFTMGSSNSSVIPGFSLTLSKMKPDEKAIGLFTSKYGYKESSQGISIDPYSPLIFEIELVKQP